MSNGEITTSGDDVTTVSKTSIQSDNSMRIRSSSSPTNQDRHERWVVSPRIFFNLIIFRFEGLLGVRNKPDPLLDWDHVYNLKNQGALRKDCRELFERIRDKTPGKFSLPQIESLITLYCKVRPFK